MTEPMKKVAAYLQAHGIFAFIRWNMVFACPPLIINDAQLQESLTVLNEALAIADQFVE